MRTIDLGVPPGFNPLNEQGVTAISVIAGCRMLAVAIWPTDEERRAQFLARLVGLAIAAVENAELPLGFEMVRGARVSEFLDASERIRHYLIDHYLLPLGGFKALINGPSYETLLAEAQKLAKLQNAAGWVLIHARVIADEEARTGRKSSVRQAVALTEKLRPQNHKDIWEGWTQYENVAHLWAASILLNAELSVIPPALRDSSGGLDLARGIWMYLSVARDFQKFATGYRPRGQPRPIIDPSEIWGVPEELPLPDAPWQKMDLNPAMRIAIDEYRAPQQRY